MVLIAVNVIVYVITASQGGGINLPGGELFSKWALQGNAVSNGDWWRLVTAMFLHGSILHIAFNMLALYWLGTIVEQALGTPRFLLVYFVSGLAGSAGALWFSSPVRGHRRRLGRDLRAHRRAPHPRVPRDRLADGTGDGADPRQPRAHLRGPRHLDRRPPRRACRRHRRHVRADALPRPRAGPRDRDRRPASAVVSVALAYARVRGYVPERAGLAARPHDERHAVDPHHVDRDALRDRPLVLGARAPVLRPDAHLPALARPSSIAITTTARLPTTVGAFDGTCGVRLISRSSGLRVRTSAATETTAKTSELQPDAAADARRDGRRDGADRRVDRDEGERQQLGAGEDEREDDPDDDRHGYVARGGRRRARPRRSPCPSRSRRRAPPPRPSSRPRPRGRSSASSTARRRSGAGSGCTGR